MFKHPSLFGKLALQSLYMMETGERLVEPVLKPASEAPLEIYLDWGLYDLRTEVEAWNMVDVNRDFAARLEDLGFTVAGGEVPEGGGWNSWRMRTDDVFETLFPGPRAGEPTTDEEPESPAEPVTITPTR